jgi:hypothetical protein
MKQTCECEYYIHFPDKLTEDYSILAGCENTENLQRINTTYGYYNICNHCNTTHPLPERFLERG